MLPGAIGSLVLVAAWQVETPRTQPPPSGLQLVVERTELSRPDRPEEPPRSLLITLFNPGPRTVHGFFVQSMTTSADGRTSYGGVGSDAYAFPGQEEGRGGPILPGARRIVHTGYPYRPGTEGPVSFGARVVSVIFEDDTAVGDEKEIQYLFERRALNQRTWPLVGKVIAEAVAAGGEPQTVLERIASALEAISDESFQRTDAHAVSRVLSLNVKHTRDPALLLETFVAEVRERRAATEAHWRRKY
jgi:hypothetical protein